MDLSVVPYEEPRGRGERSPESGGYGGGGGRYRECMRNHAAAIGGQAYDGCGEFMPGGVKGTLEALKCAACGCHRNFHRRDGGSGAGAGAGDLHRPIHLKKPIPPPPGFIPFFVPPMPLPLPYNAIAPPPAPGGPIQLGGGDRSRAGSETPPRRGEDDDDAAAGHDFRGGGRKRFRTKFTADQKEKMQAFAEKLGWRIQKHDDVALDQFCLEIGVKRHVLKVWMHNNKNHHLSSAASSAATAANPSAVSGSAASPAPIQV